MHGNVTPINMIRKSSVNIANIAKYDNNQHVTQYYKITLHTTAVSHALQRRVPPLDVTRRKQLLPPSATRTLPKASTATPMGLLKMAVVPAPLLKPPLVPAPPPTKVDTTASH